MTDPPVATGPVPDPVAALASGLGPQQRAALWARLAETWSGLGRRGEALLAARTALALLERLHDDVSSDDATGPDPLGPARRAVRDLTGPDVGPLTVAVPAGAGGGPGDALQARAVWLGAPVEKVLAMLGWVERDGSLEVVRVVVPGTRRGRAAFAPLLAALPREVPVRLVVPARDPALVRSCRRAGFTVDVAPAPRGATSHVGGTVRLLRAGTSPRSAPGSGGDRG